MPVSNRPNRTRAATTRATTAADKGDLPSSISVRARRAPTNEDGKLAAAKIPFIAANDAAALAREAKKAGMTALGNNQFMHPTDRSWVMLDANGRLQRGVRSTEFQGIPPVYVEPPDPAEAKKLETLLTKKPRIPASMKNYAVAQIGIVDASTCGAACTRAGFAQIGNTWVHPDGSWVRNSGGAVRVGWMGYTLDDLPYQRGWL